MGNEKEFNNVRAAFEKSSGGKDKKNPSHLVIVGPPGSGKVFMAHEYTKKLLKDGLIQGECLVLDGDMFKTMHAAEFVGGAEKNIQKTFSQHKDGVIIFENIYDAGDHASSLIYAVTGAIEERKGPVFIFTGEPEKMEKFLNENKGLKSRLPHPIHAGNKTSQNPKTHQP
jgi:hypothetical protein